MFDLRSRIGMAAVLLVLIGVAVLPWFGRYGEVSDQGYEIAMALFSACNRKDLAKIDELTRMVGDAIESKALTAKEGAWFRRILGDARSERWDVASKSMRSLLNAQVKASAPLPELDG